MVCVVWDSVRQNRTEHARRVGRAILFLCLLANLLIQKPPSAAAQNDSADAVPWREFWAGADVTENTELFYSGATLSPFGHIHDDGLRIRFTVGFGQYDYTGLRAIPAGPCHPAFGCRPENRRFNFDAITQYAEVLVGYLKRFGELTAKVFIGATYSNHSIVPVDPANRVQGADWGVKGGVELWINLGETAWTSLDAHYTTAHNTYAARSRFGYRIVPTLSLGPELGINGHIQSHDNSDLVYTRGRGGLFARYEWAGGEVSASGGLSADIDEQTTPYVTVNWITRY